MRRVVTALLMLCVWGCKDGSGPSTAPATITALSGNGQSGTVAHVLPLPLTVRVATQSGAPARGVHVLFAVAAGGGQLSASDVVTDASGEAEVTWVLGTTAGTNSDTATASVAGLSGPPVRFTATARAGTAARTEVVAGNFQQGAVTLKLPDSLVVRLTDGWGNPITDSLVVFTAITYGSTFFPETALTDNTGRARTAWRLGAAPGEYNVEARPVGVGPVAPATATAIQIIAMDAHEDHACVIISTGQPYCWGKNDHMQLGDNSFVNRNKPTRALLGLPFASVTVGNDYSCALTTTGAAYCWGGNANGRLGDGSTEDRPDPTPVQGGHTFQALAAGSHTCGLTTDGDIYCWGKNGRGQLGDNSTTDRHSPTLVAGGHTFRYLTVSHGPVADGDGHSCALTDHGDPMCWGANSESQVGNGSTDDSWVPVDIGDTTTYNEISAGTNHTCALAWTDVYCWGSNSDGQFGNGTTVGNPSAPVYGGGINFIYGTLSAGAFYTCGTAPSRAGVCWGDNASGQLGDNSTTPRLTPVGVAVGYEYWRVHTGRNHSCGMTIEGVGYCWGANDNGQVGDGTFTNRLTPVTISWRLP